MSTSLKPELWDTVFPFTGPLGGLLPLHAKAFDDIYSGGTIQVSKAMRPMAIAMFAQRKPLLIVVPTPAEADMLQANLGAWIGPNNIETFPAWETMAHERLSPQVRTVGQRLKVLDRIRRNDVRVVIAPVRAVMQPMDPRLVSRAPIILNPNGGDPSAAFTGTMEDLATQLSRLGYTRSTMVMSQGEFAVRGGLVDIFPTTGNNPVRIEFFGDDIDELRLFDPETQRTIEPIPDLTIYPAREIVLDDATRAQAQALLPYVPSLSGQLDNLANNITFEGAEGLVTAIMPNSTNIIEVMGAGTSVVISDFEQVAQRAIKLVDQSVQLMVSDWAATLLGDLQSESISDEKSFISDLIPTLTRKTERGGFDSWNDNLAHLETQTQIKTQTQTKTARQTKTETQPQTKTQPQTETQPQPQPRTVWKLSPFKTDYTYASYMGRPWETFKGNIENLAGTLGRYLHKQTHHVILCLRNEETSRRIGKALGHANIPVDYITKDVLTTPHKGIPRKPDGRVRIVDCSLQNGLVSNEFNLIILGDYDILGSRRATQRRRSQAYDTAEDLVLNLKIGDPIVHDVHGVGLYQGIVTRQLPGTSTMTGGSAGAITKDYVVVGYAKGAKLFVPSDQVDSLNVYAGGESPRIMRMGGAEWTQAKRKAKEDIQKMTAELMRLYQVRNQVTGHAFVPDVTLLDKLEEAFPFAETTDQMHTIDEVKADMAKPKPMDRLVLGDVGFGKTEVAVRAAGVAVFDGKQAAVLVPTTLLAQQHGETFTNRFSGLPVDIRVLSRFSTKKEVTDTLADLAAGKVDIVIGTHRILSEDIVFNRLGLIVVDEEQRFGVAHKEKLKQLKTSVDVLSMSATPIPRTMEMAIMGIRDMSKIETAPVDKQPVITQVTPWDENLAILAVRRELLRDGQVFWLHNKVETIAQTAAWLHSHIPDARIKVAHGQMNEDQLEKIMVEFWNNEIDVLVATTIIENGIDIENANTLVVERADMLGLSQLYQLRGRVGRSSTRGHAHFFYPGKDAITEDAWKRLEGIATHTNLGAGMSIAMEDLAIRGAGMLFGTKQSGSMIGIGIDAYNKIVNETVRDLTDQEQPEQETELRVDLPLDAYIPTTWIDSEQLRLQAYQRIAGIRTSQDMKVIKESLADRFGKIPPPAERLLALAAAKSLLRLWGIEVVSTTPRKTIRIAPVELLDSQQIRLYRTCKGAFYDEEERVMEIPMPKKGKAGDLVGWMISQLVDILGPPQQA